VLGSVNGTYVVDDWMSGIGNFVLSEPIMWKIKNNRVLEISGGIWAERLKELIQMKDENAVNVGEFALGTNHLIKDVRGDHFDKAILGGMHLALGTNVGYGLNVMMFKAK
jgi:leucyl aminopeptidase (aminopeptidase T)